MRWTIAGQSQWSKSKSIMLGGQAFDGSGGWYFGRVVESGHNYGGPGWVVM